MPTMNYFIDSTQRYKKLKLNPLTDCDFDMSFFNRISGPQFLAPPPAPARKRSQKSLRRDDVDDFLSSDFEASFASTVSLSSPSQEDASFSSEEYAMDISPAPAPKPPVKSSARPRAFTSAARLFGNDVSNSTKSILESTPAPSMKSSSKKTQRSGLPTEWTVTVSDVPQAPKSALPQELSPAADDAMDVDTSFVAGEQPAAAYSFLPVLSSAAPTITAFNSLFFDSVSPPAHQHKKRRSLSPEAVRKFEPDNSSSPLQPSPSQSKVERIASSARFGKPTLEGLGAPPAFPKRLRRPALSAMTAPSGQPIHSAFPVLLSADESPNGSSPHGALPVRRAFSALIPQSNLHDGFSDESSIDATDMSSPAQAYAKRQQVKTIRRCDGTEDFRPLTGATAMIQKESPSKFMSPGLPGFGDNEAHGKILPCHRVREDGLMRITCQTLDNLLDGEYDSQIVDYHVIDCRFDYEYSGGHIPGAANINTTTAVEELLLGPSLLRPRPSTSGDSVKKTILVFHCEFSAKRAPTFAKHLRAKDRAMNNHVYPKIHFPEVYILEGGYCQYFKTSPLRCEPQGYITMDDPTHAASRREDLDQFRKAKFGRHKSYTYGDGPGKTSIITQQQKRNTAPNNGQNQVFAAANAARTRRGSSANALMTLPEDGNTTVEAEDTDTDLGDSPCPPPTKTGMMRNKRLGRAETYHPVRMAY